MENMNANENLYTVSVSAPGKVILHGEHSVVYGKTAVAACLGLRSSIVIKELPSSDVVNIHLPSVNLQETIQLRPIVAKLFKPRLTPGVSGKFSWRLPEMLDHDEHMKNVEGFLLENKPDFEHLQSNQKNSLRAFLYAFSGIFGSTDLPVRSLDISLGSELTIGAGTGSSASFAVCLAGALIQLIKLKSGSRDFDSYYDSSNEQFSTKEKEIVSAWAYNCEKIMHGSPSGIDNATCTFGSMVSFRKGSRPAPLQLTARVRVLLVDTRVGRQTSSLVMQVAALRKRHQPAVQHVLDALDHVAMDAIQVLEKLSSDKSQTSPDEDYQQLAELWDMNHWLLGALGVSHEALERVRAAARARHLASKLTGAGGGGYAMVLIPPSAPRATIESLCSELLEQGFRVTETTLGGAGVAVEM